jgi:radical SAM protein with 4Fe4S-binding SPASM domain
MTEAERGRRLTLLDPTDYRPHYVVWELTLACDQPCTHCGSRAGDARPSELTTSRAVEVARELAQMQAREVVLIGGEAYLHEGFLEVVQALSEAGVLVSMTTGGRGITPTLSQQMKSRGMHRVSVSVDGVGETHDRMRAVKGGYPLALSALSALRDAGISVSSNTNINRFNMNDLEALYLVLRDARIKAWQVQVTAPLGRAADRPEMLLQPYDYLTLMPRLAALKRRAFDDGIFVFSANNLGFFGPEEALMRSRTADGEEHFQGCPAGKYALGIESDGAVKGCPSLQTSHYVGGSLQRRPLAELWQTEQVGFARGLGTDHLWGFCAECTYASVCKGGCTFTAHSFFGRPGNQPYCHYRAIAMKQRGKRERLVPRDAAPGSPFDHGLFELIEEPFDAPEPAPPKRADLVKLTRKPRSRRPGSEP